MKIRVTVVVLWCILRRCQYLRLSTVYNRMIWWMCWKKFVSDHGVIEVLLRYLHGRTDEKTKSSITLAGDLTEIRGGHFHKTSIEPYFCISREGRIIREFTYLETIILNT
jgi:hypothetical protein